MKKHTILVLLALVVVLAGCVKKDIPPSEKELLKEEQIFEEVHAQQDEITKDIKNSGDVGDQKASIVNYQLSIPDSYTRVNHSDHIYVYDSNGNSLNVSSQSEKMSVYEYTEKNYHQLISSAYKDVKFQTLEHIVINEMKAIRIEYIGNKNDKNFMNCRYYIENGENTILIDLQAVDESDYKKLKTVAEEMIF